MKQGWSRRHFLGHGAIVLAGTLGGWPRRDPMAAEVLQGRSNALPAVRFGVITDVHYADKPGVGTRAYRDSLAKMQTAVAALNQAAGRDAAGLAFAITLGDMVDTPAPTVSDESIAAELGFLKTIETEWSKVRAHRHYVLGNHCVDTLTKAEFFAHTAAMPAPYAFDVPFAGTTGALHVVVLDACYRADGTPYGRKNFDWRDTNIPAAQLAWLAADLEAARAPIIVFTHQRLDGTGDVHVRNAADVRGVLEASAAKVVAVLQGHSHQNVLARVNGIPYCVLRAMVEQPGAANNAFATVEVFADFSVAIRGQAQQTSYEALA